MHNADCDFLGDVNAEDIVIVGLGEVHFARFYASTARVALTSQRVHCQIQAAERFGEPATHCGFGKPPTAGSGIVEADFCVASAVDVEAEEEAEGAELTRET